MRFLNKLLYGDCMYLMKKIPDKSIDLILVDPPYDEKTHKGGRFTSEAKFGNVTFKPLLNYNFIEEFLRLTDKWILIFCSLESLGIIREQYTSNYVRGIIWDRINPSPQISGDRPAQACEGIALLHGTRKNMKWNGHGKAGIYRYSPLSSKKIFETEKPLNLIIDLIQDFSNKDDIILDSFAGSCTTFVGAMLTGRNCICMENNLKNYKVGKLRIESFLYEKNIIS